jgi:hypothetical protein
MYDQLNAPPALYFPRLYKRPLAAASHTFFLLIPTSSSFPWPLFLSFSTTHHLLRSLSNSENAQSHLCLNFLTSSCPVVAVVLIVSLLALGSVPQDNDLGLSRQPTTLHSLSAPSRWFSRSSKASTSGSSRSSTDTAAATKSAPDRSISFCSIVPYTYLFICLKYLLWQLTV